MKTKLFAAVLILVVFVVDISSLAHAASSTVTTVFASDDTYVFAPSADVTIRQDAPDKNYGFITTLQTDNSPIKNFLLKFDITGVGNRQILKATLRLYDEDPSSMGGDFHFMPDSTWDEGTVTWNNAPDQDPFIYASLGSVAAGNWYEVDLTSLIAADGVYSLRVTSTASNGADYASREGSNPPQLVLIVSNNATPASTITPTFTSTPSQTPSNTPIATYTPTDTPALTQTPSPTPSTTPTQTLSSTPSTTSTFTPTSSSTPSQMPSNTPIATHTPTKTPSNTPTATFTPTSSPSSIPTATFTPSQTPSATPSLTPTPTRAPSHTPTSSIDDIYVFAPSADVTIRQDAPDRNYGFITTLQTDNSPVKNFLLKFDINGIGNRQVLKATLRLYDEDPSSMGGDFHSTSVLSWDEGSITWNNAPEPDSFLLASLGTVDSNNWYEVDLTSLITTDGVYSLRVGSTSTNGADFASRESTNPPQLVLIVSNNATPASTITPTYTSTSVPTPTTTNTPKITATPTDTLAPTNTPTFTSTSIPTATPTDTLTLIPTVTPTFTFTSIPTATSTNAPTSTPTVIPTNTLTPTIAPTYTSTSTPTVTPTGTPTSIPTATPTNTLTPAIAPTSSKPPSTATAMTPTPGPVLTFTPAADAYVNSNRSGTNYGSSSALRADGSPPVNSYLRFTVQGLGSGSISQAQLLIHANSSSSSGLTALTVADNNWEENTITYANAPALGSVLGSSPAVSGGTWIAFDVTSYITSEGTFSFGISTPGSTALNLSSRESGANAPQLVITTHASISTETATPISTPIFTPTNIPTSTPTLTITPTSSPVWTPSPSATPLPGGSLTLPLRLAFYYPWFPEAWTQSGVYPFTNYTPSLGFYDSSSPSIVNQHIADMQYAGIQGGIASWWGQGTPTDGRINTLLTLATGSNFKWTLYYEPEGTGNPTAAVITSNLTYIFDHYAQNQSFLHIGGKPVIFVYADATDDCSMADRWKAANTMGFYVVLKVFSGYTTCENQPNSWHQYGPASNFDQQGSYSATISPGFWKEGDPALLVRDITRWNQDISNMVAANPDFQLITTWNEWGEGTSIEPSMEFGRSYLDALHNNGQMALPPYPTSTPLPTPTSSPTSQPSGSDPTIVAAGDIICDSLTTSSTACQQMAASQVAVDQLPTAALILGDLCHTPSVDCFDNYFNPSWGRLFSISHPTTGNHDYLVAGAVYYFDYWNGTGNMDGPAGNRSQGYYSFDIGTWHIISLNSQCSQAGGCNSGSPQYTWLQQDLQNHANLCTLAYYHIPVFSSGGRANNNMKQIYTLLYDHNVEVILNGHDHIYERFAPQDPNGLADPSQGIREFIVGTGGANHTSIATVQPNSEVRNTDTFGALKLTLHPDRYDWQFMPVAGKTFSDSGTTLCH